LAGGGRSLNWLFPLQRFWVVAAGHFLPATRDWPPRSAVLQIEPSVCIEKGGVRLPVPLRDNAG